MLLYFCVSEKRLIIIELDNYVGISVKKQSWVDLLGEMSNFSPENSLVLLCFFIFSFENLNVSHHFAPIKGRGQNKLR